MAVKHLAGEDIPVVRGKWPLFLFLAVFISGIIYVSHSYEGGHRGWTLTGVVLGILSVLAMLFLMSYKIRKHVYRLRLGPTNTWLSAHKYIGIVVVALVLMHTGFRFSGDFSAFLLALFLLVISSGMAGALIYKLTPVSLTKASKEIPAEEQIMLSYKKFLEDADKGSANMAKESGEIYAKEVRPLLLSKRIRWGYLLTEERALIRRLEEKMERVNKQAQAGDHYSFRLLTALVIEKERLAFRFVKLQSLNAWLTIHLPLSFALIAAVIVHIVSVTYF